MLLGEVFKLRTSEIAGNAHFSVHFCIFKVSKVKQPSYTKRGTLPESLKSGEGTYSLCPPVPASMIVRDVERCTIPHS